MTKTIGNQAVYQLLKEAVLIGDKPKSSGANASADKIKSNMENISGMSLSDIKVRYNSNQPSQLGALAFTKGNEIHVAPGQEMHLPHEMWHAVQQKQGRVRPTGSIKGNAVNRSAVLEKEADVMGMKALSSVAKSTPPRSGSKGNAAGKVVQKKGNDKTDKGKNNRKAFDDWFDVWKKKQNASKTELDKLTDRLKKEDPIGFGDKFNRYNSGITNALGEEYEIVSGSYYLGLSLTGLGLEVLRWVEDQGSKEKLPTFDEINKRAFDMLKEDERYQTFVAPILYVIIGGASVKNKINSKISETKTTSVKKTVKNETKSEKMMDETGKTEKVVKDVSKTNKVVKKEAVNVKKPSNGKKPINKKQQKIEQKEKEIDKYLEEKDGKEIKNNPDEGKSGEGRQGDRIIDNKKVEYKTLETTNSASSNTIKNIVNNSIRRGGQAREIIIDARNTNLTKDEAIIGIKKAMGISRDKIDKIRIIGKDYDITNLDI